MYQYNSIKAISNSVIKHLRYFSQFINRKRSNVLIAPLICIPNFNTPQRFKYLENKGVKGIGGSKKQRHIQHASIATNDDDNDDILENEDALLDNK